MDIDQLIEIVAEHRTATEHARPFPGAPDCLAFAVTEAAEYIDAVLRGNPAYLRNNAKTPDAARELAQTGYMIASAIVRLKQGDQSRPTLRITVMADIIRLLCEAIYAQTYSADSDAPQTWCTSALAHWQIAALRLGHDPLALLQAEAAAIDAKYMQKEPTA